MIVSDTGPLPTPAPAAADRGSNTATGPSLHSVRVDVPDDDLCLLPATRLAGMLRAREVSARELLAAHLARVDRLNPTVNALVTLDVEGASAAAAAEALARGKATVD